MDAKANFNSGSVKLQRLGPNEHQLPGRSDRVQPNGIATVYLPPSQDRVLIPFNANPTADIGRILGV